MLDGPALVKQMPPTKLDIAPRGVAAPGESRCSIDAPRNRSRQDVSGECAELESEDRARHAHHFLLAGR